MKETYEKIRSWLEENGYEIADHKAHSMGIPCGVWVDTPNALAGGAEDMIVVAEDAVYQCRLYEPWNNHSWQKRNKIDYTTTDRLREILDSMLGCGRKTAWGC